MRNAFIDELVLLARENDNVALVVGDLGYKVVEPFADEFPTRFINAGVAEQNMTGLAAGMASEGFHVFTYSIANFPTFRCAEQIRNDIDYHNLPVTIVSVGGGLSYGNLGYSHHAIQDYALIRCMPNMLIAAPGDPMETRACLRYLVENPQPSYLRIGKAGELNFHKEIPKVEPGVWLKVKSGEINNCILSTGTTLNLAHDWTNSNEFLGYSVFSMPLWGMKFKNLQMKQLLQIDSLVTIEDHLQDGGFGSWLVESIIHDYKSMNLKITNKYLLSKICGEVGSNAYLNSKGGICVSDINS
jgi:transketolase